MTPQLSVSSSTRRVLLLVALIGGVAFRAHSLPPRGIDHLVPFPKQEGLLAEYQRLWQGKLLVTPGDIARFVHLPALVGEESAVSVYRSAEKENGMPGGYWVTVTQASSRLWNCIPGPGVKKPVDPRAITVERCDLPVPESTAIAIRDVWRTMLSQIQRESGPKSIVLDSSTEIYSTTTSEGTTLVAQAPNDLIEGGKALALMNVANSLIEYCNTPASQRPEQAKNVEKDASTLLKRLQK